VTRRLLLGYVAIVLVLAGSLAVPFGLVFAERQREQFAVALERDAVVLATVYEDALQKRVAVDPQAAIAYTERTGARVVVVDQDGISVVDTAGGEPQPFTNRPEIVTALSGGRFSGARFSQTLEAVRIPRVRGGSFDCAQSGDRGAGSSHVVEPRCGGSCGSWCDGRCRVRHRTVDHAPHCGPAPQGAPHR